MLALLNTHSNANCPNSINSSIHQQRVGAKTFTRLNLISKFSSSWVSRNIAFC